MSTVRFNWAHRDGLSRLAIFDKTRLFWFYIRACVQFPHDAVLPWNWWMLGLWQRATLSNSSMLCCLNSGNLVALAALFSMVIWYTMFWHDVQVQYNSAMCDSKRIPIRCIFVNVVKSTLFTDGYDAQRSAYADFKDSCMKYTGPRFVEYLSQRGEWDWQKQCDILFCI